MYYIPIAQPLEHSVDNNEATGATDASRAVHDHRSGVRRVCVSHAFHKHEQLCRVIWHAVVRPCRELEVLDLASHLEIHVVRIRCYLKLRVCVHRRDYECSDRICR